MAVFPTKCHPTHTHVTHGFTRDRKSSVKHKKVQVQDLSPGDRVWFYGVQYTVDLAVPREGKILLVCPGRPCEDVLGIPGSKLYADPRTQVLSEEDPWWQVAVMRRKGSP